MALADLPCLGIDYRTLANGIGRAHPFELSTVSTSLKESYKGRASPHCRPCIRPFFSHIKSRRARHAPYANAPLLFPLPLSTAPSFPLVLTSTNPLAMNNSLSVMTDEQNSGSLGHLLSLHQFSALSDAPYPLDSVYDLSAVACPVTFDERWQKYGNAVSAGRAAAELQHVSSGQSFETMNTDLELYVIQLLFIHLYY